MNKRLIEWNLPLADISEESAREKNIRHGHISTVHTWWARRPLASSRVTAFAALVDDPGPEFPEERNYLLDLIRRIAPWEAVKDGNTRAINEARKILANQYSSYPVVADPFSGGGSIPLEALRLGCETYSNDTNPVAVLVEKASIEWPQKFGLSVSTKRTNDTEEQLSFYNNHGTDNLLVMLLDRWAKFIQKQAEEELNRFYPKAEGGWVPAGYLWARTIPCQNPACGAEVPLIRQFWLARKSNRNIAYKPIIDRAEKKVRFEVVKVGKSTPENGFDPSVGTVHRGDAKCLVCGQITKVTQVRRLALSGKMGERLIAVILRHPNISGKKYHIAEDDDLRIFTEARNYLDSKLLSWPYLGSPIPDEKIPTYELRRISVPLYGMKRWSDLFNARQKLALA